MLAKDEIGYDLSGRSVLVVGGRSDDPWAEAFVLAKGADRVVRIDKIGISSTHPKVSVYEVPAFGITNLTVRLQVETIRPHQLASRYLDGDDNGDDNVAQPFDLVLAFGSLELLGLGRLGDGLHPWADAVMLARAWCLAAQGARLVTALPVANDGQGEIVFNSHR